MSYIDFSDESGTGVYDTLRFRLTDEAGRREDHVIDLLTMTHTSSTLYDYAELAALPEAGIALRGVVAPLWNSSTESCDAFALIVGEQTVWFREFSFVSAGSTVQLELDADGNEIRIFLCDHMNADGTMVNARMIAFNRETLTRLPEIRGDS